MKKLTSLIVSTSAIFWLSTIAPAADVSESWKGGTGNWNTAGNWTPATVPNNVGTTLVYDVTIDSGGTDSVSLDINPTIASLVLGGSTGSSLLKDNGAAVTLTVTGALTVNATGNLSLATSGDVGNVGSLTNTGSVSIGTGTTLNLTSQSSGVTDVVAGSTLSVSGTFKAGSNNALANLNSIEGTLNLSNGQSTTATPGSGALTVSSSGTLDVEQGSTVSITGNVSNSGEMETGLIVGQPANTLNVSGTFANSGSLDVGIGFSPVAIPPPNPPSDVANFGSLINTGGVTVAANSTLSVSGNVNNSGTVTIDSFTPFAGSTLSVGGTLTNNGTLIVGDENDATDGNGSASISTLVNHGEIDVYEGGSLSVTNGINDVAAGSTIFATGIVDGLGNLNSIEGSLSLFNGDYGVTPGSGTLTVSQTGVLNLGFADTDQTFGNMEVSGNLLNSGSVGVVYGSALSISGALTNKAGGSLFVEGYLFTGPSSVTVGANSSNAGTIDLESGGSLSITGNLSNSGTVESGSGGGITANTLNVSGTFTNNSGANLYVGYTNDTQDVANIGILSNNGTVYVGDGATLNLTGATATNFGRITLGNSTGATLEFSGSSLTLNGTGILTLTNSNITSASASGTFVNKSGIQGSGSISVGSLNNQGTINANQSTPLILQASNGVTNSKILEANKGATLQLDSGTYTQTSTGKIDAFTPSKVILESGVIVNGGTFITTTGGLIETVSGGNATLNGITNSGTFQVVDSSTLMLQGTDTNNGGINVGDASGSATLSLSGNVSLNGTGKVTLSNNSSNLITGASGDVLTNANTIQGAGNIGNALLSVVNNGTIIANQSAGLIIDTNSTGLTNNGKLSVSTGDILSIEGGGLTNFNSSTSTLTGGTYSVSGTLQLANTTGSIVTNAANITLTGTTSQIINGSSANALANLATNNGSFTLSGSRSFTTAGSFTNAGTLTINSGSKFSLGGAGIFAQSGGTTTDNGTLAAPGGVNLNGGSLFGKGSIVGTLTSSSSGAISPGASWSGIGILKETGTYVQNSGTLDIAIDGTAGSQYDQFNPTKATLSGTLNINRPTGFIPSIGSTFKIMNFASETGTFSAVNGLAINSTEHFAVTYQPTDVLLTVMSGAMAPGQPAFNLGAVPADSFLVRDSVRAAAVTQVSRPASVPDHGSTLLLLILSLLGLLTLRWPCARGSRNQTSKSVRPPSSAVISRTRSFLS